MSAQNETGFRTFQATAVAIAKAVRVDLTAAGLVQAGAAALGSIGVTQEDVAASGYVTVRLWTSDGDQFVTASVNNIAKGDKLYPAASGQVTNVAGMLVALGVALEASTAVGDIIIMLPLR